MKRLMHIVKWMIVTSAIMLMSLSCVYDDYASPSAYEDVNLGVEIRIPTKATNSEGYQVGTHGENFIDISNGKFRMYFFSTDNILIDRFEPRNILTVVSDDYINYQLKGVVPKTVTSLTSFKMVVIANWPVFEAVDNAMQNGITKLSDLWTDEWAQYQYLENIELNFQNAIPFYGVRLYENVSFEVDKITELEAPVDLLRSLAKIEVIFNKPTEEPLFTLTDVKLDKYNKVGYCSPIDVDDQGDYVHTGDNRWDLDYAPRVNLVSGCGVGTNFQFRSIQTDNSSQQIWMAYVPEYKNVYDKNYGSDDFASLNLRFSHQPEGEAPFVINFAEYTNGQTDNTNRYDIERNNLYRFTVSADLNVNLKFGVYVDPYTPTEDQEVIM